MVNTTLFTHSVVLQCMSLQLFQPVFQNIVTEHLLLIHIRYYAGLFLHKTSPIELCKEYMQKPKHWYEGKIKNKKKNPDIL